jgi:hypothetical protein
MWKLIAVGIAAIAIATTSLVSAQETTRPDGRQRWQANAEDLRAFEEARLAALKAGLMLSPDQAKNWPAFEQASQDLYKLRRDRRMAMRSAAPSDNLVERLQRRATTMSDSGAALKKVADALDPLYKSLDENQKQRFAMLSHLGHSRWQSFRGRDRDGRRGDRDRSEDRAREN